MFNQFKKFTVEIEGLLINYVIGGNSITTWLSSNSCDVA